MSYGKDETLAYTEFSALPEALTDLDTTVTGAELNTLAGVHRCWLRVGGGCRVTTVLTIAPLGGADMTRWCGGWATRQGEVIEVPSAANLTPTVITDGAAAFNRKVHSLMASTDGDVIGFGHSQGAQILSEWLRAYANADPTRLRFVLTGNPERRHYGYAALRPMWIPLGNVRGLTPDDTPFAVLDIGRQSDRFANSLRGLAALLAFWPHAGHLDYSGVNPDEIPKKYIVKEVGNTKYANVP